MNQRPMLFAIVLLSLFTIVSAGTYLINVSGQTRTPDGKVALIERVVITNNTGSIESDTVNRDTGYFEANNVVLDDAPSSQVIISIEGSCFSHAFRIVRDNGLFVVSDAYASDQTTLMSTINASINLGALVSDKSNMVLVDSDVPMTFIAKDEAGNTVAENIAFRLLNGNMGSFRPHSAYTLILTDKDGNEYRREITTGNYCEGAIVIKRGSHFETEITPNNTLPPIGILREIWFGILGLRPIVVVPLLVLLIIIAVLIMRRK